MRERKLDKLFYYLGTLLMLVSVLGVVYTVWPILWVYVSPSLVVSVYPRSGSFVIIPKIRAEAPVFWNVNPWDEAEYRAVLQKGVAHAKGTALPGSAGTVFLFAHSSGLPWEVSRYNTIFLRLGELQKKDEIVIIRDGKVFRYVVREKKEVWPSEVGYLVASKRSQLVLQTCTPIGTSLRRLLVFADLGN